MSILTEKLPDSITVCGRKCHIKTDFKVWLEFSQIISKGVNDAETLFKIIKLAFKELPPNLKDGIYGLIEFYRHSIIKNEVHDDKEENLSKQYFDFEYDADLIYSAFYQQYKIDLSESKMHWWKFKALLGGLSEETHFIKVIQYRSMDISKIKDKEQKKYYQKMKASYKLPDNRSEEQKEQHLNRVMEGMF